MKKNEERPFLILGRNIAEQRKRLGLSQDGLAYKTGINITSLKDMERGVSEGHIDTRMALASTFGCMLSDLYKEKVRQKNLNLENAAEFLSAFVALPIGAQHFVTAFVFGDPDLLDHVSPEISAQLRNMSKVKKAKF